MKCPNCHTDNPSDSKYCKDCATPLPSFQNMTIYQTKTLETPGEGLATGSTFAGRYQIIEELGHGGMGRVYRAFDKKLNEEVALKLIKPEIASEKRALDRFSNELKLARKISHRNVGRMYEILEEKGIYFITMEYVRGEDLKSSLRRFGQLPIRKSIALAKQLCEGLAEAHKLGVVHRDLKPSNIMVDREGNAKIMDFGIARSLEAKGITGEGAIVGTPAYMSPEQVEGNEADQRADIYSLGVILYEMVTGKVPFDSETPLSVAYKQRNEIPLPPQKINPQISEGLNHLILRCLEKDKEKRYSEAESLLAELSHIEKLLPTTDLIASKWKLQSIAAKTAMLRIKKLMVPIIICFILLIAGGVLIGVFSKKSSRPRQSFVMPSVISNPGVPIRTNYGRVLKLEERVRIADDGKKFHFAYPFNPELAEGFILIGDSGQLLLFYWDGKFFRNLIKTGNGPGEFSKDKEGRSGFYRYAVHGNEIFAQDLDGKKIVRMDIWGGLIGETRMVRNAPDLQGASRNYFIYERVFLPPPKERVSKLVDVERRLQWAPIEEDTAKREYVFLTRMFIGMPVFMEWDKFIWATDRDKDYIFVSRTREYQVELLDLNAGRIIRSFRREFPRVKYKMSEKEEKIYKQHNPPPKEYESDILDLFVSGGLLWVRTSVEDPQKGVLIDVFNEKGQYIDNFYVNVKGSILAVRGDSIFVKEMGEDGKLSIVLYRNLEFEAGSPTN